MEKKNWLLLISYIGTNYFGWQIQPNQKTVQGTIENAIYKLTGLITRVNGAGRTDSGVHALNQTASFCITSKFSGNKWREALNAVLPDDLVIKSVIEVPFNFHARHNSIAKTYRYVIYNQPYLSPFFKKKCWWIPKKLNIKLMINSSLFLLGKHDFSAFRSADCSSPNPIKEIRRIKIGEKDDISGYIFLEIEANSFLQHMIRIIVGTLVETGLGKLKPEKLKTILKNKNRKDAGPTAPSFGLYVLKVHYKDEIKKWTKSVLDK